MELIASTPGWALALCFVALLAAGVVKGVIGLGLPLVAVPVISHFVPATTAMAIMCAPILLANLYQASSGRDRWAVLKRVGPAIAALCVMLVVGVRLLVSVDEHVIYPAVGAMVILFAVTNLMTFRLTTPPARERWVGPLVGGVSGLMGGITSFFGPPMVIYFVSLNLGKDAFVTALGLLYFIGAIPLYGGFAANGVLTADVAAASLIALAPAGAGVLIGQALRRVIPQEIFRRWVLGFLIVMGASLIIRGLE